MEVRTGAVLTARRKRSLTDPQAWIFLSVGDAGGASDWTDLDKVIGMADSNNHAIPSVAELRQAVRLLTGADLVERDGNRLRLTPSGSETYRTVNAVREGHITRFLNLTKAWEAAPPLQVAAQDDWPLTDEDFRTSWDAYHERFWDTYRKLKEEGRM